MSKRLFSPIGGTDPIKYFRDGSMLHICRHYKPDIVYLYLSHEMMEYHRKDNRYIDTIQRLGELLGHSFDIRLIERAELIHVQQYDVFYQDFREEIRKIEADMQPEDELLINLSSGTPAMKSALLVLATLAEYRFLPVQVSTPQKKINSEHDDREEYDSTLWELNEDNEEDAPNRCEEVKCLNLMKMLKIEAIKKHIRAYDYSAALAVANEIRQDLSEDAFRLLLIANDRIKLNLRNISKHMEGKPYDIYPVREGNKQKIFEYALVLQIKTKKQEYADFLRGITPLVVDLFEHILKNECGIKLEDCCTLSNEKMKIWNREKLEKTGLLELLNQAFYGNFRMGPVYSSQVAKIICQKSNDAALIRNVSEIAEVERKVRNPAAHDIISVTDEWIQRETKKTVPEILAILKYLVRRSGIHVKEEDWNSYDRMNDQIEQYLRQSGA